MRSCLNTRVHRQSRASGATPANLSSARLLPPSSPQTRMIPTRLSGTCSDLRAGPRCTSRPSPRRTPHAPAERSSLCPSTTPSGGHIPPALDSMLFGRSARVSYLFSRASPSHSRLPSHPRARCIVRCSDSVLYIREGRLFVVPVVDVEMLLYRVEPPKFVTLRSHTR